MTSQQQCSSLLHSHSEDAADVRLQIVAWAKPDYLICKRPLSFAMPPQQGSTSSLSRRPCCSLCAAKNNKHSSAISLRLKLNSYKLSHLLYLLDYVQFSARFLESLLSYCRQRHLLTNRQHDLPRKSVTMVTLFLRAFDPPHFPLDYKWNYRIQCLLRRNLELEKMLWWLSTLGGAFSSLGDAQLECALRARQISWRQLSIALSLGDPVLAARCKLYIALSLIQTKHLKLARRIIKSQFRFALEINCQFLRNICFGVWAKLQFHYSLRRNHENRLILVNKT